MAAAVLNPQLTAMLTALEGAQAGLGDQFVAHVGTTMALAWGMPNRYASEAAVSENTIVCP